METDKSDHQYRQERGNEVGRINKEEVIEFFRRVVADQDLGYRATLHFEAQLAKADLLSSLEDVGILCVVQSPNPFDPIQEEEMHEQWWVEHPQLGEEFVRELEEYDVIIRHLYMGAMLGHLFPELFPERTV
jgi:hypothetical protein